MFFMFFLLNIKNNKKSYHLKFTIYYKKKNYGIIDKYMGWLA